MKLLALMVLVLISQYAQAEALLTDTWVNWTPNGKIFDVVCFSKREPTLILKEVRVLQLNRRAFQYKDADGEIKAMNTKSCFFEQKDNHPVSRDEFFEEIVAVKCNLNQIPFKDGDFRILGTNLNTTSVKRLRDGRVWILPTNDCMFTTQLPKKAMMPVAQPIQQPSPQMNSELTMFPGESDQMKNPVNQSDKSRPAGKPPENEKAPISVKLKKAPDAQPTADKNGSTIKSLINNIQ
jgi:hypothetical protein